MNKESEKQSAFLFTGTGIAPSGNERAFFDRHAAVMKKYFDEAEQVSGIKIFRIFEGQQSDVLDSLENQLFTYAFSCGMCRVFRDNGFMPSVYAPYSLGNYAALAMSGTVGYDDGVRLITEAFSLMTRTTGAKNDLGMGVVIGYSRNECKNMIKDGHFRDVHVVNSNNETCQILAGTLLELQDLLSEILNKGAIKAELLPVTIPYHHPVFLSDASTDFDTFCRTLIWNNPDHPVLSPVDQQELTKAEELRRFTSENLKTPINWQKVVESILARGITLMIECGPGIALTQNGRFISPQLRFINVKNSSIRAGI
jgi:[acyl-carrier-protein] S-malonyltransferase